MLDTNVLDAAQLAWARATLRQATEPWKIAYFHHPLYGNAGRHGSNVDLRVLLEPVLIEFGVQVVFSGHDHVYERLKPQRGIHYFVAGSGGQLRKGDLQPSDMTAAGFDQDQAFMLVEIVGDELYFQTVSRTGATVDSGRDPPAGGAHRQLTPKETTMNAITSRDRRGSAMPEDGGRWRAGSLDATRTHRRPAARDRSPDGGTSPPSICCMLPAGAAIALLWVNTAPESYYRITGPWGSSSRTSRWCCSSA